MDIINNKFRKYYTPSTVTINVADGCNLSCSYCFENNKKQKVMNGDDARQILDVVYADFDKNFPDLDYFMVNLFGGEPLLAWDTIKDMIDHKNKMKYKMRFGITTNLTLLTDEMIKYIEEEEIFLLISIDGVKSVHDKNRNNSYDKVAENIKKLVDAELDFLLEARMTILPEDVSLMYEGIKEVINLGIYNIAPMPVTDVEWDQASLDTFKTELDKTFDYYLALANDTANHKNVSIKLINDHIEHVLEPIMDEIEPCTAGTTKWCAIGTDGTIMPCHQRHTVVLHYDDLKIGNILTDEIDPDKIINPIYKDARNNNDCNNCKAKAICRGGCPSENLDQTGSWYTPTKSWCDTMKILYNFAKVNHKKIMGANNLRIRKLNVLKANLEIKDFFEKLCDIDVLSDQFIISLNKFKNMMEDQKEIILPTFYMYYKKTLTPIYTMQNVLNQDKELGEDK